MASSTLQAVLAAHLRGRAGDTFLIAPETGRTHTYGELGREAGLLNRFLASCGLAPGDTVGLYLPNGLQAVQLFLSCMAAGYVAAPLNLLAQRSQLAYVLEHCDCRVLFVGREEEKPLAEALALVHRPIQVVVIDPDAPSLFLAGRLPSARARRVAPEDPALLMYTSGTTGVPKGVLLTHANVLAGARAVAAWHGLGSRDRVLSSLPLYHINGQVIATVAPFVTGGSIVAPRRFSVSAWWDLVRRHRPTWLNMVPTIIAYLLSAAPGTTSCIPSVRFGRSASAPLPPQHLAAFERKFGVPVFECMGMTETASNVFASPHDPARRRAGSVGVPCGTEVRLVDGEIRVRGPNVMQGYYKSPEETAQAFDAEGWLRTGDLGRCDAEGYYFITGRLKELIIKGGENIAPREIDEALLRHPGVLEAAAVGIPDPSYGQDIRACVVPRPGVTLEVDELRSFCTAELGRYKTPREFRIVAELPKGPSGKVQRLRLAELS